MAGPLVTISVAHRARTGHASQDRHIILPNAVAVLDGATNPDEPPDRDGGWYADLLAAALAPRLIDSPGTDLADLTAGAISEIARTHKLAPGNCPSSTLSVLRWDDDHVEAYAIADSPIAVALTSGEVHLVFDDRLDAVAAGNRAACWTALRAGAGFGPDLEDIVRQGREQLRAARNTPDGFWIAEAVPDAARHAVRKRWDRDLVSDTIVCSDGVAAAVHDYQLFRDWRALLDVLRDVTLADILRAITQVEATDPDGRRWPRLKYDDDATAIHVTFASRIPLSLG